MKERIFLILVVVGYLVFSQAAAQKYTFDTTTEGWSPVGNNVTMEWTTPGYGGNGGCMHVKGVGEYSRWNYVRSPSFNITAGKFYQMTGYIKLSTISGPAPFFKADLINLGIQESTTSYNLEEKGIWQKVINQFQAPTGSTKAWFALEKGTNQLTSIDCWIDSISLEEISGIDDWYTTEMAEIPSTLEAKRGIHPRLYFTDSSFESLKSTISNSKYLFWREIFSIAISRAKSSPPVYNPNPDNSGNEQLWQRSVGSSMPFMAMAYKLTGNKTYLNGAINWALKSCSYPTWGLAEINGTDLATGHQLNGLSLVYDWLFNDLNSSVKSTIRSTLIERTNHIAKLSALKKAWWATAYLQNHQWVDTSGIGSVALALFDDPDETIQNLTRRWLTVVIKTFKTSKKYLSTDGASHEGPGYWGYGVSFVMKWYQLSKTLLGEDLWAGSEFWSKTASYRLHMSLPRSMWREDNCLVDIGDSPRYQWYGNDYILYGLASIYNDHVAQYLANEILRLDMSSIDSQWHSAFFFNPALTELTPKEAGIETFKHFSDIEIVAARSDWNGNESLIFAKCGPPLGHSFMSLPTFTPGSDAGAGHAHPDQGHFDIIALGDWQIIDDGYTHKYTVHHNTLVVNDGNDNYLGQCGEGNQWMDGGECTKLAASPSIPKATTTADIDYIVMNPQPAYATLSTSFKITKFMRHLLFLKKLDIVLLVDDIESDSSSSELSLLFHTEKSVRTLGTSHNVFEANGTNSHLRIECLTPNGVSFSSGYMKLPPGIVNQNTIKMTKTTNSWKNAVAISWSKKSINEPDVSITASGFLWTFFLNSNKIAVFDTSIGEFQLSSNGDQGSGINKESVSGVPKMTPIIVFYYIVFSIIATIL